MSNKDKIKIIEVNGLVIKTNSVYKVLNRPDSNAPDGFIKEGTTKLPSLGIGNSVPCRYIITNKSKQTGVYDTGLYEESPCYASKSSEQVREKIKVLNEHIVIPFEKKYGKGTLSHSNVEFWDEFGVGLYEGRYFITSNVDDLLALYIVMTTKDLVPKGAEGDPSYSHADYCVEDKEKVQSIKSERANLLINCISNFSALKENKTTLLNTLRYIGLIGVADEIDNETLNSLVFEWLNKSDENPKKFDKVYKLVTNESTSDIVNLYAILNKLFIKKVIQRIGNDFYYEDTALGADLKTAALNLNNRKELEEIKIKLIEL